MGELTERKLDMHTTEKEKNSMLLKLRKICPAIEVVESTKMLLL